MINIVLIADDCKCRAAYLETRPLPDFYMEDFSIQGFTVRQYDQARELLRGAGYTVLDKKISADIVLNHVGQLREIRSLFELSGIKAELSDIADSLYQA